MKSQTHNPIPSEYEDYEPPFDVVAEEECETILIYLPGFKKDQLRVQLTTSRILKISGERPSGDRWKRFNKEFRVPTNIDTKGITAKYEGGILYVRQPKFPADKGKATSAVEAPKSPSPQQAPDIPQPQPQQQPLDLPQLQPQQQAPDLPQPQPELQAPDLPQPQPELQAPLPQPLSQQEAPLQALPEPHRKGPEEHRRKYTENVEEASVNKDKFLVEDGEDMCAFKPSSRQVTASSGLFRELRKPENLKRLVVSVLLVLSIGFYTTYMFKSFVGDDKE